MSQDYKFIESLKYAYCNICFGLHPAFESDSPKEKNDPDLTTSQFLDTCKTWAFCQTCHTWSHYACLGGYFPQNRASKTLNWKTRDNKLSCQRLEYFEIQCQSCQGGSDACCLCLDPNGPTVPIIANGQIQKTAHTICALYDPNLKLNTARP
jgi:hypothetical protein